MNQLTAKIFSATVVAVILAVAFVLVSAGSVSAQPEIEGGLCQGGSELQFGHAGANECNNVGREAKSGVNQLITNIVNIFSIIVGIVAVIMIIYGGFRYITSGGESGNVSTAKNTILYAIIGLVIVALAQFIVRFVLSQATSLT